MAITNWGITDLLDEEFRLKIERDNLRLAQLNNAKSQEAKDKLLDRWNQSDNAEKIADAIRWNGILNNRRGLFF